MPGPFRVRPCSGNLDSAFHGTGLEAHLRQQGIETLVLIGAVAAFCVTSTTRWASDLGFKVLLPGDALIGFDIPAHDGGRVDAETLLRVSLSLLGADFATLVRADEVGEVLQRAVSQQDAVAPA